MVREHRLRRPEVLPFTSCSAVSKTTKNGDGANGKGYIDPISNGDAFDTTGYSEMGRTLWESAVTFSAREMPWIDLNAWTFFWLGDLD